MDDASRFFSFGLENKHGQNNVETNSWLDWGLQLDELHSVLQSMKGRRSPGVDGLTLNFTESFGMLWLMTC